MHNNTTLTADERAALVMILGADANAQKIAHARLRLQTTRAVTMAAAGADHAGQSALDRLVTYASLVHVHLAAFDELIELLGQEGEKEPSDV